MSAALSPISDKAHRPEQNKAAGLILITSDHSPYLWVILSLGLHVLFVLLLLWLPLTPLPDEPEELEIPVTFVPLEVLRVPPPIKEKQQAPAIPQQEQVAPPDPALSTAISESDDMVRPQAMLSASSLAQDNNQKARLALSEITADERLEQLCTLEAMEQIQAWNKDLTPDLLLSYPFEEVLMKGNQLIAKGAAFFSQNKWFYLHYECDLAADGSQVSAFAFKIGDAVPRRMWESHNLVEMVVDSVEDVERYNDKTRSEHSEAR